MDATVPDPRSSAATVRDASQRVIAGRYTLQEFLGDGAFSEVYAAWDVVLQRRVAIKLVWAATGKRPTVSPQRFLEEARTAAGITHRHIVAVHDVGEHQDAEHGRVPYLVMEALEASLSDTLSRDGSLGAARVCAVLADICDGLAAAHAHRVVHRDVKPANILLAADGTAKLGDFGIARTLDDTDPNTLWNAGTPPYLAPERFEGRPSVPASDVWAVGVVLYETLAGARPFADPAAVLAGRYPALDPAGVLPDSLVRLVASCLDRDPTMRPPAHAVARALRHHAGLAQLQSTVSPAERVTQAYRLGTDPPPPAAQPVADQPVADQPVADRPVADQPVAAQPIAPQPVAAPPPAPAVYALEVVVDPAWYAAQDVDDPCPPVTAPVITDLDPAGVLVGRPSTSLASRPHLDLSSDVGISRRHCRFTAEQTPEGVRWSVEDLSSSNGTFVAAAGDDLPTDPLVPGTRHELEPGDRIYVGAWTRLTLVGRPA